MIDRCPLTRKVTYLSRESAEHANALVARLHNRPGMRPYVCAHYPHWHLGHPYRSRREALLAMVHDAEAQGLYDLPELPAEQAGDQ